LKKKILIFSQDASSTGAPIFLLNLCKFLKLSGEYDLFLVFKDSGTLIEDFKKVGLVFIQNNLNNNKSKLIKILIRFFPIYKMRKIIFDLKVFIFNPKILLSNTIVNSKIMSLVPKKGRKIITIVHEMKEVIDMYDKLDLNSSSEVIANSDKIIAVSRSVKKDLINQFNVSAAKIKVLYNHSNYFQKENISKEDIEYWKSENGIPVNVFLVGTCGGPIWRKGPDIFLNIVKSFISKYPKKEIFFVWLGGIKNNSQFLDFQNEITRLEISKYVAIIPQIRNVHYFFNAINMLISTSREEPFGLTILEAGTYSKPCLAFKHSGGPEELLSNNRGIIVSYADYNTAADEINNLIDDEKLYNKYASSINKFVIKNNSQNSFLYYKEIIDSFIA
tara:strand:+ start:523 stop:1689 length:1167 start_codon:yes stop_codon:yes gene_type:complete